MTDRLDDSHDDMSDDESDLGILREYLEFLAETKKWWLLPILIIVLGVAVVIWIGGTAAAPFIYPLF